MLLVLLTLKCAQCACDEPAEVAGASLVIFAYWLELLLSYKEGEVLMFVFSSTQKSPA